MLRWTIALLLASGIVLLGVPWGRSRAFKAGWFERSGQTRRTRGQRRPTHGGVVLAVALAAGSLLAGPSQPAARAVLAVTVLAVLTAFQAERGRGAAWLPLVGRAAAAAAVPLLGVRVALTGTTAVDAVLTALVVLLVIRGVRSIERSDGTAPLVVAVASAAFLLVATDTGDPVAPIAAALVGACLALVAHAWPPALVRIGAIGPTVLGGTLAVAAVALEPAVPAPRSALVPILALATLGVAAVVPEWDRRLRRRGLAANLALPLVALPGAFAAVRLATGDLGLVLAVGLAVGPPVVLGLVGLVTPAPSSRDAESHTGRAVAILSGAVLVLGVVAVLAGLALYGAGRDMQRGRDAATAGLDAARAGDLEKAQAEFATADAAFDKARDALGQPYVRVGDVVPGVAQNLRSARALAEVGGDLSGTAVAVAQRAGADDLQVVDGRFPVDGAEAVSAELGTAVSTLRQASRRLAAVDSPWLVDKVREASDLVGEKVDEATDSIEVAAEATRLAPALLGADGDKHWMVAILTPSEERGAGGLAGDYAELLTHEGDISLVDTFPASALNGVTDPAVQRSVLPPVYERNYAGYFPGRYWQNLPVTPDVPTFATAVAAAYPKLPIGGPVDGFISIDPIGIAGLLELTGPVSVPEWPVPISADNAASVLLFEHYNVLSVDEIQTFQSTVVRAIVEKLTTGTLAAPSELAAALAPAVEGGHLRLWSPDHDAEALFARIGADGALERPREGDFVQLVTQNAGENKIDWFMQRTLDYRPTFDPTTGDLTATAAVTITNNAPADGVSSYIIGEEGGPTDPGENRLFVTIVSPHRITGATLADGTPVPLNLSRENGLRQASALVRVPAGAKATITFSLEGRIEPTNGRYRLLVGHQPTVNPDAVHVELVGPAGWRISSPDGGKVESTEDAAVNVRLRLARG